MQMHHRMQQVRTAMAKFSGTAADHKAGSIYYRKDLVVSAGGFYAYQGCWVCRIEEFGHVLLIIDDPEFLWSIKNGVDEIGGGLCQHNEGS